MSEDFPNVDVRVIKDDKTVMIQFDKNIGILRIPPEIALRMADMLKLEAVKILRAQEK